MFTIWVVAAMIALLLIRAALHEKAQTSEFAWNSDERIRSKAFGYLLSIAAFAFIVIAVASVP